MNGVPRNKRWLILLALFQLVAGPLVLLQVMVFCQVTAEKAPEQGLVKAATEAFHSAEFQRTLDIAAGVQAKSSDSTAPEKSVQTEGTKLFGTLWEPMGGVVRIAAVILPGTAFKRSWTPVGLLAPPGQPPRVA